MFVYICILFMFVYIFIYIYLYWYVYYMSGGLQFLFLFLFFVCMYKGEGSYRFVCVFVFGFYGRSTGSGCLFSILRLISMICIRNWIAFWCMAFSVFLVADVFSFKGLYFSCIFVLLCIAPLALL
jgi:hypothetical protein